MDTGAEFSFLKEDSVRNASYSIEVDKARGLLRITMSGFFTEDEVLRFVADKDTAINEMGGLSCHQFTLVDIREMQIQTQEIVMTFRRVLSDQTAIAKPIAFLVSPSLARSQIRRAAGDRKAEYFTSIEAAETWLLYRE